MGLRGITTERTTNNEFWTRVGNMFQQRVRDARSAELEGREVLITKANDLSAAQLGVPAPNPGAQPEGTSIDYSETGKLLITFTAILSTLALFIIGCVGAAGRFPNPTLGYVTLGLSSVNFVSYSLITTSGKMPTSDRVGIIILNLLSVAPYAIVGALGGANILAASRVGWGILGTQLSLLTSIVALSCCCCCCRSNQALERSL